MNAHNSDPTSSWQPAARRLVATIAATAGVAIAVLFAWNSFAVPVLDADTLHFKEALGLTLLVAITGRLLTSRAHRHARRPG